MICCRVGLADGVYFCKYFKTLALISVYNSIVWILTRPSAQACFMSEMLLIAWSLMLLTKTCLLDLQCISRSQKESQDFTA